MWEWPPQRWSAPDKVYLGHRQLRTYQQMPDAKVAVGGGGLTAVLPQSSSIFWKENELKALKLELRIFCSDS